MATTEAAIQPSDIDTKDHFWDTFGRCETEISARYLVRFCKDRGNWSPFTYADIDGFYQRCGLKDGFLFNGLIEQHWIAKDGDMFTISQSFIDRCYKKHPAVHGEGEAPK